MTLPILEHNYDGEGKMEPSRIIQPRDVAPVCVITFFREVLEKVIAQNQPRLIAHNHWEDGPHPLYEMEYKNQRLAFFHPGVGSAMAASLLEEVIAFGCRKFIVVGGAGALEKGLDVGKLVLVTEAIRDEGVSYHYLPPSRSVAADPHALQTLDNLLQERGLPYHKAKTWTTDAPYRETPAMIAARRAEGCFTVEMEAAALMAVAQFRGVSLGQVLYAGDDLSGDEWDNRGWQSRQDVREHLFWLAADACLAL